MQCSFLSLTRLARGRFPAEGPMRARATGGRRHARSGGPPIHHGGRPQCCRSCKRRTSVTEAFRLARR